MQIVWDEPKRLTNLLKHKLDFESLSEEWFATARIETAHGRRLKAIGRLDDGTIVVIFATLGAEALSVISMRPAKARERRLIR